MILGYTLTTFPKSRKTLMHNQSNRDLWHNCKRNKRNNDTQTPPKCEQKDLNWLKISMCHSIYHVESMDKKHSINLCNHEGYPVHLKYLRNIKKIKYPDFQAMTIDLRDAFHTLLIASSSKNVVGLHHIMDHLHTTTFEWVWV